MSAAEARENVSRGAITSEKIEMSTLNGMQYAGNSHMRFDEGKVASAKPRRGALLCKRFAMLALVCMGFLASAKTFYVAKDGNDTTGDGSFESPYLTPSNGIAHAETDDVVFLKNGTYEIRTPLTLNKKITLRGEDRETTIIRNTKTDGASYTAYRVVNLTVAGARVESLTLCDGICNGAQGKPDHAGGNISMTAAGVVSNCVVRSGSSGCCTGNPTSNKYGGGNIYVSAGLITHCVVSNGAFNGQYCGCGGGIAIAGKDVTIDTCLITGNRAGRRGTTNVNGWGGGVYVYNVTGVKILNSTITGNAATLGGGIYCENKATVVKNCIIAGNTTPTADESTGAPNWHFLTSSTVTVPDWAANVSSCLWGNDRSCSAIGAGSFVANPGFTDATDADYTLGVGSLAIGKGVPYEGIPVDLNGTPRKDPPDLGCYQSDHAAPLSCSITIEPEKAFVGTEFSFSGAIENGKDGATYDYYWTLVDRDGNRHPLDEVSASFEKRLDAAAEYDVYLNVTNHADASDFAEAKSGNKLFAAPFTNYVTCATDATPVHPYATPETAAKTLATALTATIPGSVVALDAGTHKASGTIVLADNILILGAGREETVLQANGTGFRIFELNNAEARLENLTVRGANAGLGSGVYIDSRGGKVHNCRITQCYSAEYGSRFGGALKIVSANGLVENCVIDCNTNNNSINFGWSSDSPFFGVIGITGGTLRNSLIRGNYTGLTPDNCCFAYRVVQITGNGRMENCTLVDNTDIHPSGGVVYAEKGSSVLNCIFARNSAPNSTLAGAPNWVNNAAATTISNNCWAGSIDLGSNCVDGEKVGFKDADAGDFRIGAFSSCRNKGQFLDWMDGATDLDGNPRVVGKAPDIGCYECPFGPGLILLFR